jgi:hypothetical protein
MQVLRIIIAFKPGSIATIVKVYFLWVILSISKGEVVHQPDSLDRENRIGTG